MFTNIIDKLLMFFCRKKKRRDHKNVFDLIEKLIAKPINFIVEAGSFVGSSANMWAKFARKHDATVLCIDTCEGDVNMCRLHFL